MNAHDLAPRMSDDPAEEDQRKLEPELKSGIVATTELASSGQPPDWSKERPSALLPHDPLAFEAPPPLPDHEEVLRLVALEALGRGLTGRMF
jgi:hypothetical protein